jgi:glucan phosphorylase
MNATNLASFDLAAHGITVTEVHDNLRPNALHEHAIRFEKDASIAENGARWRDPHACTRQSILDTARMGKLSSDCWIRDYCERVWKLRPASVAG